MSGVLTEVNGNAVGQRIWFDTEFIDTGSAIHLLSIGLVREDGITYYAEPAETDRSLACPWVKANVIPHLCGPVKPRKDIAADLLAFCGPRPEFWGFYVAYDWVVLCQLFGPMVDLPQHWPQFPMDVQQLRALMGVKHLPAHRGTEHNALADAFWTRSVWRYLNKSIEAAA